ncbi:MAG: glycosyltransferase family 2 protein [Actinomycetota bacterium]|nr:glycosyltransferase family 2 protein [Actinomycetota bacterium]
MTVIDVVVPSFGRPERLAACLAGLRAQHRPAARVLVVLREGDEPSEDAVRQCSDPSVVVVRTGEPGQVAALRCGVAASTSELVAFTDDDAVPRPDWIGRILDHFEEATVGAVGGRDVIDGTVDVANADLQVGRVGRWGKVQGNHHRGAGPARDVDILKGVNMAFRRVALAVPRGLSGSGAEPHNDAAMSLHARRLGWRVVYDPQVVVDHFPAARAEGSIRGKVEASDVWTGAYNLTLALLSTGAVTWWRRLAYGIVVGDRGIPGIVRTAGALARRTDHQEMLFRLGPSMCGQIAAARCYHRGDCLVFD